jgi:tetratricopeptide (TPR) repeat protein
MLMSAFIDQLLEADSSSDTAKCTVFFFFDATSAVRNYPGALLRSLCAQILAHNPEMADVVYEIVVKSGQPRATSMTYLFRTLRSLLDTDKNLDTITFVIDALDECNDLEESGVLDFLLELVGNGSPKLRLLLSSRAEPGLRDKLKSYQKLSVTPEKTYADIEMYIRTSLKNSNMAAFQEGRLLSRITERLMSNANGQFIWVRLILDELRKAAFVREIDDILDNLPAGLEKAYLRIFHRLSKEPRRRQQAARDIFYWLSCAERPLSLRELEYALALRLGDQKLEPVAQMLNLESLLNEVCGSLVEIVGSDKTMVRFVHVTIKQFLVAPLGTWETDNKALLQFHVDAQAAHAYLATTCLTQLHFPEVEGISTFQNRDGIQSKCQLLSYASMFWATHLSRSGQPTHELLRQVSNFLTSKNMEAYLGWYSQQKTTAQSITLLQSHLTAWISQLPSGDPRVNSTVNLFQKHFEKTAQSRAEEFGWNSPEHLESIHQLATLLHSAGAWEAAEKSARQCAEAREQIFGIEHPSTMESQFQLGSLLRRLGRVSEAVKLHTTVVEGRRRMLGIYHPDTLDSEDELATTTNGGKTFDHIVQAEQMSRDTLLRKIRQYGEEHERTAATKNILASTLKDKALVLRTLGQEILAAGTLEECVELCHACMQVRRIAFGDDHPEVITTWNMLGIVMQLLGRLEESEEWHQKTFRARQKIFGPHNPHTQRSMRNLVNTYAAQFEKEKSDKMKQRLMTSLQKNPVLLRRTSWERFKLDIEKGYLTGY